MTPVLIRGEQGDGIDLSINGQGAHHDRPVTLGCIFVFNSFSGLLARPVRLYCRVACGLFVPFPKPCLVLFNIMSLFLGLGFALQSPIMKSFWNFLA